AGRPATGWRRMVGRRGCRGGHCGDGDRAPGLAFGRIRRRPSRRLGGISEHRVVDVANRGSAARVTTNRHNTIGIWLRARRHHFTAGIIRFLEKRWLMKTLMKAFSMVACLATVAAAQGRGGRQGGPGGAPDMSPR